MEKPFPAYSGDESYIFVSYAHVDASRVYPEIQWLHDQGFNVWYDEGIEPGSVWRDELAESIRAASLFLFFVTPNSVERPHCQREVAYASDHEVPVQAVFLSDTVLPPGMDLTLSTIQAIQAWELNSHDYHRRLVGAIAPHVNRGVATARRREVQRSNRVWLLVAAAVIGFIGGAILPILDTTPTLVAETRLPARFEAPIGPDHGQLAFYALTPDGRQAAIVTQKALYAWELRDGSIRRLTSQKPGSTAIGISPDGDWVVFGSERGDEILKVPLTGGEPVLIGRAPDASRFDQVVWGPDDIIVATGPAGMHSFPAKGGDPELLLARDGDVRPTTPLVLDSGLILFCDFAPSWRTHVLDPRTGSTRPILDGCRARKLGDRLIYQHDRSLWVVAFDPVLAQLSGEPVRIGPIPRQPDRTLRLLPATAANAGHALLGSYRENAFRHSLVWIDDVGREEQVASLPAGEYRNARLSADGRYIALVDTAEWPESIWLLTPATGARTKLTTAAYEDLRTLAWSDDSQRIVFGSRNAMHVLAIDGLTPVRTIPLSTTFNQPVAWVEDHVLYHTAEENGSGLDIAVLEISNGDHRRLVTEGVTAGHLDLTRDAEWLAYMVQSDGNQQPEIYVRPYPEVGQARHRVSPNGGTSPRWSADGRTLFYVNERSLFAVDIDPGPPLTYGEPRLVFANRDYTVGWQQGFDVAAHGRFLFLKPLASMSQTKLTYIQNWDVELDVLLER